MPMTIALYRALNFTGNPFDINSQFPKKHVVLDYLALASLPYPSIK